jgi:hypothetical protein
MRIGRGNRSTRRKPAPMPLCAPQIPHDLTWARTRAAAVGSRRPTAWAMARPRVRPCSVCLQKIKVSEKVALVFLLLIINHTNYLANARRSFSPTLSQFLCLDFLRSELDNPASHPYVLLKGKRISKTTMVVVFYIHESANLELSWRMPSSWMWCHVDLLWTDVSEECIAFIFSVKESASEESAWAGGCRSTRGHIPEDCILHSHRRENLKSYIRTELLIG